MVKYESQVERTDTFKVELDETVLTDKWMADFREVFFDFYTLEEHAEHIAQHRARFGRGFIEGYGIPLENGKKHPMADEKETNRAINIIVVSEDNDINVETDEVTT